MYNELKLIEAAEKQAINELKQEGRKVSHIFIDDKELERMEANGRSLEPVKYVSITLAHLSR